MLEISENKWSAFCLRNWNNNHANTERCARTNKKLGYSGFIGRKKRWKGNAKQLYMKN